MQAAGRSFETASKAIDNAKYKMKDAKDKLKDGKNSVTTQVEYIKKIGRLSPKNTLPIDEIEKE